MCAPTFQPADPPVCAKGRVDGWVGLESQVYLRHALPAPQGLSFRSKVLVSCHFYLCVAPRQCLAAMSLWGELDSVSLGSILLWATAELRRSVSRKPQCENHLCRWICVLPSEEGKG